MKVDYSVHILLFYLKIFDRGLLKRTGYFLTKVLRVILREDQFQFGVLKRIWFPFIIDLSVWSVHLPSWHNLGLHCMVLMILLSTWRMQCHCYRNRTRNRDLNMDHLFYKNVQCGNVFAIPEAISLRHEMNICCLRAFRLTLKKRKDSTSRQILSQ